MCDVWQDKYIWWSTFTGCNVRTNLDIICMWLCIFMTCGNYIKISIMFLYVLKIVFFLYIKLDC
jgi:hypothetical protein